MPPQTELWSVCNWACGKGAKTEHSSVWSPSPLISGACGLQYQFSNTESLPVTTEALGRFLMSFKQWFSPSLLFRQGWFRWAAVPSSRCWCDFGTWGSSEQGPNPQMLLWAAFKKESFPFLYFDGLKVWSLFPLRMTSQFWQWKEFWWKFRVTWGSDRRRAAALSLSDSALKWWKTAQNTCSPWWQPDWEPETPTGHTKLRYSFKSKHILSAPCPACP